MYNFITFFFSGVSKEDLLELCTQFDVSKGRSKLIDSRVRIGRVIFQ